MRRHALAATPPATAILAVAVVAFFCVELAGDGQALCAWCGLVPAHPSFAAAVLSLFVHDPENVAHVSGNLVFLVVFGTVVERAIGSARFLVLYTAAGLAGAALHILVDPSSTTPLVGCSGALFGLLALAGVMRPRLLGFVIAFVAVNIWFALADAGGNVSFGAHIGGFSVGAAAVMLARLREVDLTRAVAT